MRTFCKPGGTHTAFIIADLNPTYYAVARALAFEETADDFAQSYPAETSNLDRTYDNFCRHAKPLILQKAGLRPVPWEQALEIVLHTIDGHSLD